MPHDIQDNKKHQKSNQTTIKSLHLKIEQLLKERAEGNAFLSQAQQGHFNLQQQLMANAMAYASLQEENQKLNTCLEKKGVEVDELNGYLKNQGVEIGRLYRELDKINTKIKKLKKSLGKKHDHIEELNKNLEERDNKIKQLQKSLDAKTIEVDELSENIKGMTLDSKKQQLETHHWYQHAHHWHTRYSALVNQIGVPALPSPSEFVTNVVFPVQHSQHFELPLATAPKQPIVVQFQKFASTANPHQAKKEQPARLKKNRRNADK